MATKPHSPAVLQRTVDLYLQSGSTLIAAATRAGVPVSTFQARLREANRQHYTPSAGIIDVNSAAHLKYRIKVLEGELRNAQSTALDHLMIKQKIIGLTEHVAEVTTPSWLGVSKLQKADFGVPSIFVSDLHWGEVVDPKQIGGVNAYNLTIARQRLRYLSDRAIRLLSILSPELNYPGVVVILGGDMISGNIHDELQATNEMNSMPTVLDLFEHLGSFIRTMADQFKKVFIPCVSGNHGRDTKKIWAKDRHHTSFDWLLYCFLAKHFANDPRITFFIPDGPDAYYKVYNHRYLLTHGDQFRGGDGVIGVLGPVIRGDFKKRSRNAQVNQEYDTLIMGHFHQLTQLTKLIINGSLKGMDEYAYAGNFPFEKPQQAVWITHPKHGVTFRMPVVVSGGEASASETAKWVSLKQ